MSTSKIETMEHENGLYEQDLQLFIAANPWLLNMNYEAIPKHPNRCLEFQAGEQKRIDLILRDKINKTPVVVEFKLGSFTRENIGQILEYKARVAMTFNNDNAFLYGEFKEFVLTPSLVLVVKSCDSFSRIACNLSGIQVHEYHNFSEIIKQPKNTKTLEAFVEALKKDPFPISLDRCDYIEKYIYEPIQKVLKKRNLRQAWIEPIQQLKDSYFHFEYTEMFVNRLLFLDKDIHMGIIEDIVGDGKIHIVFYSDKKKAFEDFGKLYKDEYDGTIEFEWINYGDYSEGYGRKRFNRVYFFNNAECLFATELDRYISILEKMEKHK